MSASIGHEMHRLVARLFPLPRALAGPAFRETLDILEGVTGPMVRHSWVTGDEVFDWSVPREWHIRDAWIRGPDGTKVVDFRESNLHVVSYSCPVHRTMSLRELQSHLHSLPEQPEAVPYRTSYYTEDWGFCLRDDVRRTLRDGDYEVWIDSDLYEGHLDVGEILVSGITDQEVLLSTNCCHPSMANNELSGPVVCAFLARMLRERPNPSRLTYRILFLPETIGAIAYLSRFEHNLRRNLIAGYVVTCVGDDAGFTYKRSRRGDTLADRAAEHVLALSDVPFRVLDYFPWGSDERQYCSPGFDLPVGSLMRSMYLEFPQYHTSRDDLSFVTPEALSTSLAHYGRIIDVLEANRTLRNTRPFGEPQLGRRGLYPALGGGQESTEQTMDDIRWLLNLCDGTRDLLAVAERAGRPTAELEHAAQELVRQGLLVEASSHASSPRLSPLRLRGSLAFQSLRPPR